MALMTQRAYAVHAGVTPQYVNKLVAQGKIRLIGKKVDSRQADAVRAAFRRAGRVVPAQRAKQGKTAKAAKQAKPRVQTSAKRSAPRPAVEKPERNSATRSLTEARAAREHYQAELAKLDYERAVGQLLPRDQVLEAERRKNANVRARFRKLARSLAPMLARFTVPSECESFLLSEIDLVLQQLAGDPLGMRDEQPPAPAPTPQPENSNSPMEMTA